MKTFKFFNFKQLVHHETYNRVLLTCALRAYVKQSKSSNFVLETTTDLLMVDWRQLPPLLFSLYLLII